MNDNREFVEEFLVESSENLDQLDRDLLALEQAPGDPERLASIFRTVHTIKGNSVAVVSDGTAVLGLGDLNSQTIGTQIYWGNYYQALLTNKVWVLIAPVAASVVIVIGFYLVAINLTEYLDPRTRLARMQVKG